MVTSTSLNVIWNKQKQDTQLTLQEMKIFLRPLTPEEISTHSTYKLSSAFLMRQCMMMCSRKSLTKSFVTLVRESTTVRITIWDLTSLLILWEKKQSTKLQDFLNFLAVGLHGKSPLISWLALTKPIQQSDQKSQEAITNISSRLSKRPRHLPMH